MPACFPVRPAGVIAIVLIGTLARAAAVRGDAAGNDVVLPASVRPYAAAEISARATGYVSNLYVDLGDRVKKGQLLAKIDAPELDARLHEAEAAVAMQRAMLRVADCAVVQSERALAVAQKQHAASLAELKATITTLRGEDNQRSGAATRPAEAASARAEADAARVEVTEATVASAEADVMAANAKRAVAQAQASMAEAKVEEARVELDYTQIKAPFDGIVASRRVGAGDLVNADSKSEPLFDLVQVDALRIECQASPAQAMRLKPGMPAEVRSVELEGRVFEGRIARMAGVVDDTSHMRWIEVEVPNPDHVLLPGMYVQLTLKTAAPTTGPGPESK